MSLISESRGSAAVDFILAAIPLLSIFVVTVTITLYAYVRTVTLDATIEGVRYASLADQALESGVERTRQLIRDAIGEALPVQVSGRQTTLGSLNASYLETKVSLIGTKTEVIRVTARATSELQD